MTAHVVVRLADFPQDSEDSHKEMMLYSEVVFYQYLYDENLYLSGIKADVVRHDLPLLGEPVVKTISKGKYLV